MIGVLLGLCCTRQSAWSQENYPSITITVNQSRVLQLRARSKTVSVTQPDIADVIVLSPTELLINGKTVGTTSLIVWNEQGGLTHFSLNVTPDMAGLQRQLRALFPDEQIEVSSSGAAVVLKGEVANEVIYDKVLEVARTYLPPRQSREVAPPTTSQRVNVNTRRQVRLPQTGTAFAGGGQLAFLEEPALTDVNRWGEKQRIPGLIDLLVIRDSRQIQLDVIVAEISLTKAREIGVDLAVVGKHTAFLSRAGSQGGLPSGTLFEDPSQFPPTTVFGDGASAVLSHVTGNVALTSVFRLFQDKNITEILAQPRLVMKNGRSGGFLAGGEFPVPFATDNDITIDYRPFGVRLDFVPTITWSDTIDLRVFPEVSDIDPSVSVSFAGVSIPGLAVRRSVNRVEMREGETLILSGLLDRRILREVAKLPFLGDLPILGALFRTTRFRNNETELIFVVTPRIVKPMQPGVQPPIPSIRKYHDPDFRQIPVPTPPIAPPPASYTPLPAPQPQSSLRESTLGETTPVHSSAVPGQASPSPTSQVPATTHNIPSVVPVAPTPTQPPPVSGGPTMP
ncbi:MAG: pilus assembly protein N-terminal domain-containing protein [Candidatus Binatia bacterium]